jgi:hypothetical protein
LTDGNGSNVKVEVKVEVERGKKKFGGVRGRRRR